MNTVLVLAGGSSTRLGREIPKQYLMVEAKPVIGYCLETLQAHRRIDSILIVCAGAWRPFLRIWLETLRITKFHGFAESGGSRQESIYHGLLLAKSLGAEEEDIVILHDAARPCVSFRVLDACISGAEEADGAMPVLTVKDTVYASKDGETIDCLLRRDELYAGQAPESFRFGKYLRLHEGLSAEELGHIRGSTEIAFRGGMHIKMVPGDEGNLKITTIEDLEKFEIQAANRRGKTT